MRLRALLGIIVRLGGVPVAAHHGLSANVDATRPFTMIVPVGSACAVTLTATGQRRSTSMYNARGATPKEGS